MRMVADRIWWWLAAGASLLVGSGYAWMLATGQDSLAKLFWAVPLAFAAIWLFCFQFKRFFWMVPALIPISINSTDIGGGVGFSAPVEAFIWLIALALLVKAIHEPLLDARIFRHPLTWIVLLQTFWVFCTTLLSEENLVSSKFLLARLVYLWVFFFFMFGVFADTRNIFRFNRSYVLFLLPVVILSTLKLGAHGFAQKYSPAMSQPFYSDHTIYGASIAMLLPMAILLWRHRKSLELPTWLQRAAFPIVVMLVVGVVFSYSRAAWLSLVVCLGFYSLLWLRMRFTTMLFLLATMGGVYYMFQDEIRIRMEENQVVGERDFVKHAQSITDVQRDESNKERLNRWDAALQMAKERPLTGFGPGTYEFHYGIYQSSVMMTRISTKWGDKGDAHSEYLTALSEQGIPGLGIWLLLVLGSIATGMRAFYRASSRIDRIAALGIMLGLITYYVHGVVNSFLDVEKVNTLFWSSLAALVMLEIRSRKRISA